MAFPYTSNVVDIGRDRIFFDYFVNYVFPQYALPWNNFYTNIDSEPFYTRNIQRNQNARIAKTPEAIDSNPEIQLLPARLFPDFKASALEPTQGTILDVSATKTLLGQLISKECNGIQYQYAYSGKFVGVNPRNPCADLEEIFRHSKWVVFHLNLKNKLISNKQSVVVVTQDPTNPCDCCDRPKLFSTLSGSITIDDIDTIFIKNPIPIPPTDGVLDSKAKLVIESEKSNTLYTLFGNRLFLAIKIDKFDEKNTSLAYDFSVRICESPSIATGIGANLGI